MQVGGAAATSNGAGGGDSASVDTGSTDTGSDATEGAEFDAGGESAGSSGGESDAPKYKLRRGGRDQEMTGADLAKMLDDDYEHDFHGAGGKPLLQDGKPVKMRWRDIARAVQMHRGASDAMRQHNEARQRIEGIFDFGKKPENLPHFLEEHLGVESFDDWILERAKEVVDQQDRLLELAKADPYRHQAELQKLAQARFQRKQQAKDRQTQAEQQRREQAARWDQHWSTVGSALGKVGLKLNERTRAIADQICKDYAEAKAELPYEQLAEFVRDAYHDEIFGYIDGHDDEKLLALLGNGRRERLRKAELEALKGKKKAAKEAEPKPAPRSEPREPTGMTAAQFMRSGKQGGRI